MTEPVAATVNTAVSEGSGRVFVVTEPPLPATCAVCGRNANGTIKFVDFNKDLDYYGAVVICEDCIKECMSLLDYTPNINFTNKVTELEVVQAELEVAQNELNRYKSALDALNFIRPDINPLNMDDVVESEADGETVRISEPTDEGSEQTESDSDGSDSSGGLKNLSIFAD
jgi:hypothetical protein